MDLAKVFNLSQCPKCGCTEFTSHGRYQTAPQGSEDDFVTQETVASDEPYDKVVCVTATPKFPIFDTRKCHSTLKFLISENVNLDIKDVKKLILK